MAPTHDDVLAERSLTLPADRERLAELIDAVEAFGVASDSGSGEAWHEFVTAVIEIGGNILVHAYRDRDPGLVELRLFRFPNRLEARFRDWGAPFEENPAPTAGDDPWAGGDLDDVLALAESGRGLPLARAALSSFRYERTAAGENRWLLTKEL